MKTQTPLQPHSSESTAPDSESEDSDSHLISDSESEGSVVCNTHNTNL